MKENQFIKIEFGFGIEKDKDGESISRDEANQAIARIEREAGRLFSSYTTLQTHGGWTDDSGILISEDGRTLFTVQEVFSAVDQDILNDITERFATFIKHSLNQTAVAVTVTPVKFAIL